MHVTYVNILLTILGLISAIVNVKFSTRERANKESVILTRLRRVNKASR